MSTRRVALTARLMRAAALRTSVVETEIGGLASLVPPGGVCLDVGAQVGLYTWPMAALAGPGGAVHAVEPQPRLASLLRASRAGLGARNVHVHALALADRDGDGLLDVPVRRGLPVPGRAYLADSAHGRGSNTEFASHRTSTVPVRTVDGLVEHLGLTRLDLLKADVEGAERLLLSGAARTIARWYPALLLEVEDRHLERFGSSAADVVAQLADLGYRTWSWLADEWVPLGPGAGRNVLFTAA